MQPSSSTQSPGASGSQTLPPKPPPQKAKPKGKTLMQKARADAANEQAKRGIGISLGLEENVSAALCKVPSIQMVFRNYELGSKKTTVWRRVTNQEILDGYGDAQDRVMKAIEAGERVVKPRTKKRKRDASDTGDKQATKKQAAASPSSSDTPTATVVPKDVEVKLTIETEHCIGKHTVTAVNYKGKAANADQLKLVVTLVNQGGWHAVVKLLRQYASYLALEETKASGLKEMFGLFQLESEFDSPFVAVIHEDFGWPVALQSEVNYSAEQKKRLHGLLSEIHKRRYLVGTLSENNLWTGIGSDAYLWGLEDMTKLPGKKCTLEDQLSFKDEVEALEFLLSEPHN